MKIQKRDGRVVPYEEEKIRKQSIRPTMKWRSGIVPVRD